ncbi:hypothetical protein BLNAU_6225 [Blattamonas nauphoetae]|uniref:Uncharacterized protein n=1 Tax=Blattamonas nauphoetae TaxID=2049346 RepID=A0ABQ9Y4P8_9EUKA|nr:hypothetical protein BLNAU_6225 [Blattamonas nauphoetae]
MQALDPSASNSIQKPVAEGLPQAHSLSQTLLLETNIQRIVSNELMPNFSQNTSLSEMNESECSKSSPESTQHKSLLSWDSICCPTNLSKRAQQRLSRESVSSSTTQPISQFTHFPPFPDTLVPSQPKPPKRQTAQSFSLFTSSMVDRFFSNTIAAAKHTLTHSSASNGIHQEHLSKLKVAKQDYSLSLTTLEMWVQDCVGDGFVEETLTLLQSLKESAKETSENTQQTKGKGQTRSSSTISGQALLQLLSSHPPHTHLNHSLFNWTDLKTLASLAFVRIILQITEKQHSSVEMGGILRSLLNMELVTHIHSQSNTQPHHHLTLFDQIGIRIARCCFPEQVRSLSIPQIVSAIHSRTSSVDLSNEHGTTEFNDPLDLYPSLLECLTSSSTSFFSPPSNPQNMSLLPLINDHLSVGSKFLSDSFVMLLSSSQFDSTPSFLDSFQIIESSVAILRSLSSFSNSSPTTNRLIRTFERRLCDLSFLINYISQQWVYSVLLFAVYGSRTADQDAHAPFVLSTLSSSPSEPFIKFTGEVIMAFLELPKKKTPKSRGQTEMTFSTPSNEHPSFTSSFSVFLFERIVSTVCLSLLKYFAGWGIGTESKAKPPAPFDIKTRSTIFALSLHLLSHRLTPAGPWLSSQTQADLEELDRLSYQSILSSEAGFAQKMRETPFRLEDHAINTKGVVQIAVDLNYLISSLLVRLNLTFPQVAKSSFLSVALLQTVQRVLMVIAGFKHPSKWGQHQKRRLQSHLLFEHCLKRIRAEDSIEKNVWTMGVIRSHALGVDGEKISKGVGEKKTKTAHAPTILDCASFLTSASGNVRFITPTELPSKFTGPTPFPFDSLHSSSMETTASELQSLANALSSADPPRTPSFNSPTRFFGDPLATPQLPLHFDRRNDEHFHNVSETERDEDEVDQPNTSRFSQSVQNQTSPQFISAYPTDGLDTPIFGRSPLTGAKDDPATTPLLDHAEESAVMPSDEESPNVEEIYGDEIDVWDRDDGKFKCTPGKKIGRDKMNEESKMAHQ